MGFHKLISQHDQRMLKSLGIFKLRNVDVGMKCILIVFNAKNKKQDKKNKLFFVSFLFQTILLQKSFMFNENLNNNFKKNSKRKGSCSYMFLLNYSS